MLNLFHYNRVVLDLQEIPHFVYNDEISVTNLIKLRSKIRKISDEIGIKITYMPFFIKATSNALQRYPIINSQLDDKMENIIFMKSHNIGVAMDTPHGLVVPVIKDVQNKGIIDISKDLNRLMELRKDGKFSPDDLSGGTITISNIGAVSVVHYGATPYMNYSLNSFSDRRNICITDHPSATKSNYWFRCI